MIYLNWQHANQLAEELTKESIDHLWLKNKASKTKYSPNSSQVSIVTAQSSKGLEFKKVIFIGLGHVADDENEQDDQIKLIYVGMTRAKRDLLLLHSTTNLYTEKLAQIISA